MSIKAATQVEYSELVTPRWTSFLPLALILPTFWLTFAPINAHIGLISGLFVTVLVTALMIGSSPKIRVSASQIQVGKAQIHAKFIGSCEEVAYAPRFAQRVPNLHPSAYLRLQNSRHGLVKLEILDRGDPTPYWLISTKNPQRLIAAIELAKKVN
jgi:hypothetical protein